MKQRLWIITELFYPEETSTSFILSKIANRLAQKYEVKVICGYPTYDKKDSIPSFKLHSSIKIKHVKSFSGNKDKIFHRIMRFVSLSVSLFWAALRNIEKKDKVLIVTNPAPLLILISLLKKIKMFELNVLVHDVFPENTIPAGVIKNKRSFYFKVLKKIFDDAYARANKLIVLGRDMKVIMIDKLKYTTIKPKIVIIPNWGDTINIKNLSNEKLYEDEKHLKNKIVFQYAGNLGRVQGLMELLSVIKEVKNEYIHFDFIGDGAMKKEMMNFAKKNVINKVSFYPSYRREEQQKILGKCDIAIITLAKGMKGLGVPSKTYNILAAGKPILFIGDEDSEISLLIKEYDIGYTFAPNNTHELHNFLSLLNQRDLLKLNVMSKKSREISEKYYSEDRVLQQFYEIL